MILNVFFVFTVNYISDSDSDEDEFKEDLLRQVNATDIHNMDVNR